jgi:hypothetical protein
LATVFAEVIQPGEDHQVAQRALSDDRLDMTSLIYQLKLPPALPAQPFGLVSICTNTVRYGIEEYIMPQQNSAKLFCYLLF